MTVMRTGGDPSRCVCGWLGGAMLFVAGFVLPAIAGAGDEHPLKGPGDCSADARFEIMPASPLIGGLVDVTIIISNTDSQEAAPNPGTPIPQDYSRVSFWPSCSGSPPPCVPDDPLKATFVPGSASTTCGPGAMTVNAITLMGVAGGQIDFDFAPGMTIAPPLPNSCSISFQLQTDPTLTDMDQIRFQVTSFGTCDPGFGSQPVGSTDTGVLTFAAVPALGGVALAILALIMGSGSWLLLRRRRLDSAV